VQGGTPKGNVAVRQQQRQPPLDNQLGVFLCLKISYRLNLILTFLAAKRRGRVNAYLILESIGILVCLVVIGAQITG
jgi:hypothetical protein